MTAALALALSAAPNGAAARAGDVLVAGHGMHYECRGAGSPTVVLDAGSPDTSAVWSSVMPHIADVTRVCAYDRAGLGGSAPAPAGHRTALTQVRDLRGLLAAARIPPPYVVVGHSWGGLLARLFADAYPGPTAGVVLVDATTFPYGSPRRTNAEGIDVRASMAESDAVTSLGRTPLVVLASNRPPHDAKFRAAESAEAALSTDSIDAIARRSTHDIQRPAPLGQPGVVVAAVKAVVGAARAQAPLPPCRRVFAGASVTCRSG